MTVHKSSGPALNWKYTQSVNNNTLYLHTVAPVKTEFTKCFDRKQEDIITEQTLHSVKQEVKTQKEDMSHHKSKE